MTAKEYLMQIRRCEKDIRRLEERIAEIRELMFSQTNSAGDNLKGAAGSKEGSALENNVVRYSDKLLELENLKRKKIELKTKIELQIMALEDVRYADILRYRYINCMSWQKIAHVMKYSESWIKKMHGYALQYFAKKIK